MTTPAEPALRLATRASALARRQAELASEALQRHVHGAIELVVVRTLGDNRPEEPLERLDGQGWFTAELERAVLDGRADVAVHSAKDLPIELAAGLVVAGVLPRGDARDGVVTRSGGGLDALEPGSTVGTSSARRIAFLDALYPQLRPVAIRGNVDTRLRKLDAGEVDALLLACAGLDRLGAGGRVSQRLDPTAFVPAPAQGAIALEARGRSLAAAAGAEADDARSSAAARAERAVLAGLGGGCMLPLGAHARFEGDRLVLTAALAVGGVIRRAESAGDAGKPEAIGLAVADRLR